MKSSKYAICCGCGVNFERNNGIPGRYCSEECRFKFPKKKKGCKPKCESESLRQREVAFRDNTKHIQQYCLVCCRTKYLPHYERNNIGEDPKKLDSLLKERSDLLKKKYSDSFYTQVSWLKLRYQALLLYGKKCHACGAVDKNLHVDHVKPRSKYPNLSLDIKNLQILCESCNLGKGAWDETDWRNK